MVNVLHITLFGSPGVTLGDKPVEGFVSSKSQALVYYLAATGQSHSRDALAGLLWSEVPDSTAKRNLRDILSNLRQLIGPYLLITRQSVSLIQDARYTVDSEIFLEKLQNVHSSRTPEPETGYGELETISEAVALYKGEFLAGFYVSAAPLFEEWVLGERVRLQQDLERGLERLVTGYTARQEIKTAIEYAQSWSSLNPMHESAHRYLMQLYIRDSNRSAALGQYQECARILREELGIDPATETTALYKRILSGKLTAGSPDQEDLVIRGYELREIVGKGSYGAVYRAYQPLTRREVAIKIILPQYANQPDFIRRFESEAQLVARLEHPHIVPLFDYWREPNRAYLVMRWLRGGSLLSSLKAGAWNENATVQLVDQIISALTVAHRQGVVHRNIKPANILLDENGNAFLSDFGIAKDFSVGGPPVEHDANISSPAYVSPEQILGEAVSPLTDIYSFGVVLYELLSGEHPFIDEPIESLWKKHLNEPLPSVLEARTDLPIAVNKVIQKCTAKKPENRFADVLSLGEAFRLALSSESLYKLPLVDTHHIQPVNPYKGIRPFNEIDSVNFFGREDLTKRLLNHLAETETKSSFLAVVGPSGSGKSSVVKAGLLPALRQGALPDSENWFIAQMLPGEHPMGELEATLLGIAVNPPDSLREQLQADKYGLRQVLPECLPVANSKLLLVIDQFEEVFYQVDQESERVHFLECLYHAVTDPHSPLIVVITLRADYYDRPLQYADFGDLVHTHMETVMPLSSDELARAITFPAERVGIPLETGLESTIVADVFDQPGSLPLMQYALTELFELREKNMLTMEAYRSMGGALGALGSRAEELYSQLDSEGQEVTRQLFLRLVTLGESGEDTRRRVLRSELVSLTDEGKHGEDSGDIIHSQVMSEVIDRFGRYRLLTFDHDPITRVPTVEIAHEALLREWSRLQVWFDASREDIHLHRQVAAAAAEWENDGREAGFLLRGSRLKLMEIWFNNTDIKLNKLERDYLKISLAEHRQRQAAEETRQARERFLERRWRTILATLIIVLTLATLGALGLARATRQQANIATSRELAASSVDNLDIDPERSALLALEALEGAHTLEAENALHRAIQASRVQNTLYGHTGRVFFVAFSPDGRLLATTGQDQTAKIWDLTTGDELLSLVGHTDYVMGVDFSPDGTQIATASSDGTCKVWDSVTGEEILSLSGGGGQLTAVDFSPDGTRLVTNATYNGMIKVWDALTGEELLSFVAHEAPIWYVVFSPDGKRLATASMDGTAKLWDAYSGEELLIIPGPGGVSRVAFSPDGSRLATAHEYGSVNVWDVNSGQELLTFKAHPSIVLWVSFSPDGRRLATGGVEGVAKIWDADTGEAIFTLAGHNALILGISFSPDGTKLATASYDGTAKIWDLSPEREVLTLADHTDWVYNLDFSPDGSRLATASYDGTAIIWDVSPLLASEMPVNVHSLRELLIVGESGDHNSVRALAYSPDGMQLAISSTYGPVILWDVTTGKELLKLIGHEPGQTFGEIAFNGVTGVAFSPDGKLLATASDDLTAKIWEAATGKELFTLTGHGHYPMTNPSVEGVVKVDFSPDSARLATAGADGTVKLWDTATGEQLLNLDAYPGSSVTAVDFSPDGTLLATISFDGLTILWDAFSGKENIALPSQVGSGLGVSFSPDGSLLATTSEDSTTKVWDVKTGQELLTLYGHTLGVLDVAFSPDGRYLATAGMDGTVRFYILPVNELITLAQSRLTRSLTDEECQQFLHIEKCPTR